MNRPWGCEGKQRFDSMALANKVNRERNRRRDLKRCVYRCQICLGYHLANGKFKSFSKKSSKK